MGERLLFLVFSWCDCDGLDAFGAELAALWKEVWVAGVLLVVLLVVLVLLVPTCHYW